MEMARTLVSARPCAKRGQAPDTNISTRPGADGRQAHIVPQRSDARDGGDFRREIGFFLLDAFTELEADIILQRD